jgi:hypothetical protein
MLKSGDIVTCIDSGLHLTLTFGKMYIVVENGQSPIRNQLIAIISDNGLEQSYYASRFIKAHSVTNIDRIIFNLK